MAIDFTPPVLSPCIGICHLGADGLCEGCLRTGDEIARWMAGRAEEIAGFLKALSHEGRLLILCHLAEGEKSVTELEGLLGQRQAAVSQQLARLRMEGLVRTRREAQTIYYSLGSQEAKRIIALMYELFCRAEC